METQEKGQLPPECSRLILLTIPADQHVPSREAATSRARFSWADLLLTVLCPLPFYAAIFFLLYLESGGGAWRALSFWELAVVNGLAIGGGGVLKSFARDVKS